MANTTELTDIFSTVLKEINESGQSDILKGSIGSIKDLQAVLKEQDKLIDKTLRAGDEKSAMRIITAAKQAQEAQVEATNNLREAKEKLLKLDQEGNAKGRDAQLKVVGKINQEINKLAREAKLMQKNAAEFGKGAEHSLLQYSKVLENREERIKELGKTGAMIEEKFSNRFEASVSAFTSGAKDLESWGNTFAGGLKSLGGFLSEKAGEAEEKAGAGKGSKEFADMLGGLSKVVSTVAVIGGSIMMLVKLFQFVEGTVLEANKALLEGGVAIDDIKLGTGDTQKNLEKVRDTFRDKDFANAMGIPLADTMALVAGFNSLNMGIKQFGGEESSMVKMKEAMKSAKGMAFGLGISMDEAQGYMAKFSHDLGVSAKDGSIIGKMAGDFANIRDMALQSSYSTGNFFKKVQELTDQLENMNYRTKEAGTLFLRFASVLGKSGLDKALQSLFSGFRSEGYLEQMKRNMLAKSKEVKKTLKVEAIKFGKSFKESFGGETGKGGMMQKLMEDKTLGAEDEADLIKKLAHLDNKGRQDLFSRMKEVGGEDATGEFTDQLYKFIRLARGTKDKATSAEVQGAQEEQGASANLKTKFSMIESRIGDKDLNDAGVVTKEMLTKFDVTKEQIEAFAQLQTTMKGDMRKAEEIAKVANKDDRKLTSEEKTFLAKQGLEAKDGKLISLSTKTAVDNFSDYLQAQDEAKFEGLKPEEAAKTQEQYLSEGIKATTSVFDVLNNTIAGILNDISGGIYNMVSFFSGKGANPAEKQNRKDALELVGERVQALSEEKKLEEAKIKAEKERLHSLSFKKKMDGKEKKKYEADQKALAQKEKDLVELKAREGRSREQLRNLQTTSYHLGVGTQTKEEMLRLSGDTALKTRARTGKEEGALGEAVDKIAKQFAPIADIIGGGTHRDLMKYITTTKREEMSPEVLKFMAQNEMRLDLSSKGMAMGQSTRKLIGKDKEGKDKTLVEDVWDKEIGKNISEKDVNAELSKEAVAEVNAPLKKSDLQNQAKVDAKARQEIEEETAKNAYIQAQKEMEDKEIQEMRDMLGLGKEASAGKVYDAYQKRKGEEGIQRMVNSRALTGNQAARSLLGFNSTPATAGTPTAGTPAGNTAGTPAGTTAGNTAGTPAETKAKKIVAKAKKKKDFWLDGRGNLWSIDPQDLPSPLGGGAMAMTKPGGAVNNYVDQAISKYGGGGGGGNFNISITVDGSKNPVDTGRQVVNEIKKAQDKIMGGTR